MSLKVFIADYYKSFGRGAFDEGGGVVVANTESEALGLCLEACHETVASGWSFKEISAGGVCAEVSIQSN